MASISNIKFICIGYIMSLLFHEAGAESNVCSNCMVTYSSQGSFDYSYGYSGYGSTDCVASMTCSGDAPYCMTTYTTYGIEPVLYKACGTYEQCERQWWDLTRNNPNCMDVDPTTWAAGTVGECDYCCTTPDDGTDDWCNKDTTSIVPDHLLIMDSTAGPTTPTTTTEGTKTVVTTTTTTTTAAATTTTTAYIVPGASVCSHCADINGQAQGCERYVHCHGNTPYCLTSYTVLDSQTVLLKTCSSYDQCMGLWWNSTRFKEECMNEDPANWDKGVNGQCYYCCFTPEEDRTAADWCNKDSSVTLPDNLLDMDRLRV